MLTVLRDPRNIGQLAPFLPAPLPPRPPPVVVAGLPVLEQGPLAGCAGYVDAAARRVLPGHLLRRARVLSSLRVGGECLQRVAVTGCSGEEIVLAWRLQHTGLEDGEAAAGAGESGGAAAGSPAEAGSSGPEQQQQQQQQQPGGGPSGRPAGAEHGAASATSSSGSEGSGSEGGSGEGGGGSGGAVRTAWRLASIRRDASGDDESLPGRPHPRVPPERAVLALLAALRRGAPHEAARFAVWGRHASSGGWDAQMQEFRELLRQPTYQPLVTHDSAELGAGALPVGQRSFVQEVTLHSRAARGGGAGGDAARFLFLVNMHGDGCWLVRKFEAC
ncbi:MAG: hypothetical protein J3K34DRAFT_525237 [Monoraphidium minutum]|nr:MAG: hypothetical protein J3K34DRAFT_525237 [Monoraphidium minutum]